MVALPAVDREVGVSTKIQDAAGATGNGVAVEMDGIKDFSVHVIHATTPTATVTFEGSIDGTNYTAISLIDALDNSTAGSTSASSGSAVSKLYTPAAGKKIPLRYFRARISAWTAGAITVWIRRQG